MLKRSDPGFPFLRIDFPGLSVPVHSVRLEFREENRPDFDVVRMHVTDVTFY